MSANHDMPSRYGSEVAVLRAALHVELEEQARLRKRITWIEQQHSRQRALAQSLLEFRRAAEEEMPVTPDGVTSQIQEMDSTARRHRQVVTTVLLQLEERIAKVQAELTMWAGQLEQLSVNPAAIVSPPAHTSAPVPASAQAFAPALPPQQPVVVAPEPAPLPSLAGPEPAPAEPQRLASPRRVVPFPLTTETDAPAGPPSPEVLWRPGTLGADAFAQATASVMPEPVATSAAPMAPPAPTPASAPAPAQAPAAEPLNPGVMRFLTGKVLGRDLATTAGVLIGTRGTPITQGLAEQAQRQGLLSQLILEMSWPDDDDESVNAV